MRASFVFSEVVNGLRRNVTMTIAMILTTAVSLGMLGGGLLVVRMIDKMQSSYQNQIETVVYLNSDVSANDPACDKQPCANLLSDLKQSSGVESVHHESRKEAYAKAQQLFESQPQLRQLVRPQGLPASLRVKLSDPERFEALKKEFASKPGVENMVNQAKYMDKLFGLLNGVRNTTFVVALIQALAALMLISNTIQLSAFNRRTETGIMRLVGATRWYTQLPFLLEAVVSGVIGSLLAIGGLFALKPLFIDRVMGSVLGTGALPQIGYGDIFYVSPILVLVATAISAVTGYVTLRLYVRL
ncbi:cell division transport system permease protein [Saccharopolyspora lacisalsi]|uniref:Cell division protein FtsX n=1 Tax=Halosaccharopolyspora lacisalsi TaxID=1000566 RepID=A0A839DUG4_9PSEU|nr:permease-like cell division protein FtsX [Halosaccharopolyspora lacisalsi]MBA8823037.1 cell division transport system permease protein [Halosaccharopolyspora lacisalsi]